MTSVVSFALPLAPAIAQVDASGEFVVSENTDQADKRRITITGTRVTQGNAVDCPQVQADDGKVYTVSHLAASIAIGDRISVSGYFARVVKCRGEVIYVEEALPIP